MIYSDEGLKLTELFEGCRQEAYLDQAGIPTIGFGHIKGVKMGDKCTIAQAEKWLEEDVQEAVGAVNRLVKVPLTQNQFDALVDFTFNLGAGNLAKSTLLRLLNRKDYVKAADEFPKWNKAAGFVRKGLTRRREAERDLFLKGMV